MPAKEQVDEKPTKESPQTEESLSSSSSNHGSPTGLIHRLYGAVLSRDTVKKGVKRIKATYHDVLVEGRQQIDGIKRKGEEVYVSTRERVKAWAYSITIYNHFTGLWLIKNLPYGAQKVMSFDEFLSSFQILSKDTTQESEDSAKTFYKQAHDLWESIKEPQLEEIKQCCLKITARTVAIDFKIDLEGFPAALVELFNTLDSKKAEVITNEAFYVQIRKRVSVKATNEIDLRRATDTFYTFAKRFAFLEFPLTYANQDILKVLVKLAQEKLEVFAEIFLNRVDGVLNVVIRRLGYEYHQRDEPATLLDRYNVIVEKLVTISSNSYNKSRLAIQESKTYQFVDKRVHFEDRYNELVRVSKYIYDTAEVRLTPVWNAVTLTYNKVKNEYVFTLYDVSRDLVKQSYTNLKKRYALLKEATLNLRDNILEIKISKETFDKLSTAAKQEVALIYAEVRSLNYNKLKVYGGKVYQRAVDVVRSRVQALRSGGNNSETTEKQPLEEEKQPAQEEAKPVKEEEPKRTEEHPKKVEEQPRRQEEQPKGQEESPKKVEEKPKRQEESPKKQEESPKKQEESPKKQEESPHKVEEQPNQQEESPKKVEEQPKEEEEHQNQEGNLQPENEQQHNSNEQQHSNEEHHNQ